MTLAMQKFWKGSRAWHGHGEERPRRLKKRARRRWNVQPIPIEHQHAAARRRAGLSNEERQRLITEKTVSGTEPKRRRR